MLRHAGIFLFAAVFFCCGFAPVPRESFDALGATKGKPISTGFVFIDGKYIEAPYIVERWGCGIRINRQPVMNAGPFWEKLLKTQPESNLIQEEGESDGETASSAKSGETRRDAASPKGQPIAVLVEMRYGSSGDAASSPRQEEKKSTVDPSAEAMADLFDIEPVKPSPAVEKKEEKKPEADSGDAASRRVEKKTEAKPEETRQDAASPKKESDGADSEGDAASSPRQKEDTASVPVKKHTSLALKGKFIKNEASAKIVKQLNALRTKYDKILREGGVIFFGTNYRPFPINDARTTETMIDALVTMEKNLTELEEFSNQANIYFNRPLSEDLFKHRIDYRKLQERLHSIKQEQKIQSLLNK